MPAALLLGLHDLRLGNQLHGCKHGQCEDDACDRPQSKRRARIPGYFALVDAHGNPQGVVSDFADGNKSAFGSRRGDILELALVPALMCSKSFVPVSSCPSR